MGYVGVEGEGYEVVGGEGEGQEGDVEFEFDEGGEDGEGDEGME